MRGGAAWKNNAIPIESGGFESGRLERDRAAAGGTPCQPQPIRFNYGTRRVSGDGDCRGILKPVLVQERDCGERRVNDTEPAAEHSRPLATDIPGKTRAWREVLVIGTPESTARTLLNYSLRRIEAAPEPIHLFDR